MDLERTVPTRTVPTSTPTPFLDISKAAFYPFIFHAAREPPIYPIGPIGSIGSIYDVLFIHSLCRYRYYRHRNNIIVINLHPVEGRALETNKRGV